MGVWDERPSVLRARDQLHLGLFGTNVEGGLAITTVPERWRASWDDNLAVARMADEAGLEFNLSVARWHGTGHRSRWMESSLDPMAWTSAVLAVTKRITAVATVHTAMHHPIAVAKAGATADQIGRGRFAMNIVCGWNKPEYDMFGLPFLDDHVDKYVYGQEWFDIVQRVWMADAPFDYRGTYFTVIGAHGEPKPYGGTRPIVVNAAISDFGREFAVRNGDFWLTLFPEMGDGPRIVKDIRRTGKRLGREPRVISLTAIVCRPTQKEAEEYDAYYSDECADWECVDHNLRLAGIYGGHMPPDMLRKYRRRLAQGFGSYPTVGTPDRVAETLRHMYEAGAAGCTLAFVNYKDEFPYFRDEVLPRLERLGVRRKSGASAAA